MAAYIVRPDSEDPRLTEAVRGLDHRGAEVAARVTVERPVTLFLNDREIVTTMTIGDWPECLAVGFLANQNMLAPDDEITAVDYDGDIDVAVVRTARPTDHEEKLAKRTRTSGCALGTSFGDLMEDFDSVRLPEGARLRTSWIARLAKAINTTPSLYLAAGAIHGCVLCRRDEPLIYMEDVGRHNAVDKIAGYMRLNGISADGKILYTTGRLTGEMVIKTVRMGVPILISRSGFTSWGVDLARRAGLTLIGRARGRRFMALSGTERLVFDDRGADEAGDSAGGAAGGAAA